MDDDVLEGADLAEQLARHHVEVSAQRSPEERRARAAAIEAVQASGLADAAVGVGEMIPRFRLPDATGRLVDADDLLAQGPLVISFYRGGWCPYCNLELRALQQRLDRLRELGANLVAISPERPDLSLSTAEKNDLRFPVLSDHDNAVARRFGIVHRIDADVVGYQRRNGHDIASYNDESGPAHVPVPATYVVDRAGRARWAHVDGDYTRRPDPDTVLAQVRLLAGRDASPGSH